MFSNNNAAGDHHFGRHRANYYDAGGEEHGFAQFQRAEPVEGINFFQHQRSGRKRKAEENGKPLRYVPLERIARKHKKARVRKEIEHREKALAVMAAVAEGDDSNAANQDEVEDSLSSEENNALDVRARGELVAANTRENDMNYSSCSDDEEILLHTYKIMRQQSGLPGSFEEDVAAAVAQPSTTKKKKKLEVPESINQSVFEESENKKKQTNSADDSNNNKHSGGTKEEDDDEDEEDVLFEEQQESKRERIHRLKVLIRKEQKRRGNPPAECFKCMWGNPQYDAVNALPAHQLTMLMESEIGRLELRAIAKLVHKFYKHAIYLPMVRAGKKIFMWRTRDVYLHLTEHTYEPTVQRYRDVRKIDALIDVLLNETHTFDPKTHRLVAVVPNINSLERMMKLKWMLMEKKDTRNMAFYDENASFNNQSNQMSAVSGHYELKAIAPPNAINVRNK